MALTHPHTPTPLTPSSPLTLSPLTLSLNPADPDAHLRWQAGPESPVAVVELRDQLDLAIDGVGFGRDERHAACEGE